MILSQLYQYTLEAKTPPPSMLDNFPRPIFE